MTPAPDHEVERLTRRLERERLARREAEDLAEANLRRLFIQSQTISALAQIATIANTSGTFGEALDRAMPVIADLVGVGVGHAHLVTDDGRLVDTGIWFERIAGSAAPYRAAIADEPIRAGSGLVHRVATGGTPIWVHTDEDFDQFPRLRDIPLEFRPTIFAFPVTVAGSVAAVIEMGSRDSIPPSDALLEALANIGAMLGQVLERERGTASLTVANEQLELRVRQRTAELEQAREAAESANRAKSELLANLGHELRTPLTAVLGMIDLATEAGVTDDARADLQVALRAARVLETQVERLLTLAALEADELTVHRGPVDLATLIRSLVDEAAPRAQAKGLTTGLRLDRNLPPTIATDGRRLAEAIGALLDNAVKFTDEGTIIVAARLVQLSDGVGHAVRVEVHDTGLGMSPTEVEHLTEAFATGDPSPSRDQPGLGIGLSIASRLFTLLGATLGVHTSPQIGTKFWADLPVDGTVEATGTSQDVGPVLLVEDNEVNRRITGAYLSRLGLSHDWVENGAAALEAVGTGRYSVVLMDLQMPVMDGYEATTAIRSLPSELARIPIIALTASSVPGDRERALGAGMDAYLAKPFGREELGAVMQPWIGGSAAADHGHDTMHSDE